MESHLYDAKKVGKGIEIARRKRDMTQAELAEKSKLSEKTISQYESGQMVPSFVSVVKMAEACDCTPNDFIDY